MNNNTKLNVVPVTTYSAITYGTDVDTNYDFSNDIIANSVICLGEACGYSDQEIIKLVKRSFGYSYFKPLKVEVKESLDEFLNEIKTEMDVITNAQSEVIDNILDSLLRSLKEKHLSKADMKSIFTNLFAKDEIINKSIADYTMDDLAAFGIDVYRWDAKEMVTISAFVKNLLLNVSSACTLYITGKLNELTNPTPAQVMQQDSQNVQQAVQNLAQNITQQPAINPEQPKVNVQPSVATVQIPTRLIDTPVDESTVKEFKTKDVDINKHFIINKDIQVASKERDIFIKRLKKIASYMDQVDEQLKLNQPSIYTFTKFNGVNDFAIQRLNKVESMQQNKDVFFTDVNNMVFISTEGADKVNFRVPTGVKILETTV